MITRQSRRSQHTHTHAAHQIHPPHLQQVGLYFQQQVVDGCPPIHSQHMQVKPLPSVLAHGIQDIMRLKRNSLQQRPGDVGCCYVCTTNIVLLLHADEKHAHHVLYPLLLCTMLHPPRATHPFPMPSLLHTHTSQCVPSPCMQSTPVSHHAHHHASGVPAAPQMQAQSNTLLCRVRRMPVLHFQQDCQ